MCNTPNEITCYDKKLQTIEQWRDYSWQATLLSVAEGDDMRDFAFGNVAYTLDLVVALLKGYEIKKPIPREVPKYSNYKYGEYPNGK